jgi:hypothetical protein
MGMTPLGGKPQFAHSVGPRRMQSWLRRRLEDAVEDVFRLALQRGDIESAEDLLGVLESMHARAQGRYRRNRSSSLLTIGRARTELELRKARGKGGTG